MAGNSTCCSGEESGGACAREVAGATMGLSSDESLIWMGASVEVSAVAAGWGAGRTGQTDTRACCLAFARMVGAEGEGAWMMTQRVKASQRALLSLGQCMMSKSNCAIKAYHRCMRRFEER